MDRFRCDLYLELAENVLPPIFSPLAKLEFSLTVALVLTTVFKNKRLPCFSEGKTDPF